LSSAATIGDRLAAHDRDSNRGGTEAAIWLTGKELDAHQGLRIRRAAVAL
jgi:hypothetical protein